MPRPSSMAIAFSVLAAALPCQVLSVQVFQEGKAEDAVEAFAEVILSGAMDVAFDSGFVATSESLSAGEAGSSLSIDEMEKLKGEYVSLVLRISYKKGIFGKPGIPYPERFDYALIGVDDGKLLMKGRAPGMDAGLVRDGGADAVMLFCRETGRTIARKCVEGEGVE